MGNAHHHRIQKLLVPETTRTDGGSPPSLPPPVPEPLIHVLSVDLHTSVISLSALQVCPRGGVSRASLLGDAPCAVGPVPAGGCVGCLFILPSVSPAAVYGLGG